MNIPDKLKIGGIHYLVVKESAKLHGNSEKCGTCHAGIAIITINTDDNPQVQESTLIHETLEAINSHNDLGLTHQTIATLESNLHQVLKDNDLYFYEKGGDVK